MATVWDTPGLRAYIEAGIREGLENSQIRRGIRETFGITVNSQDMYHAASRIRIRLERRDQPDQLLALVEPDGGWARSERVGARHEHMKGWEPHLVLDGDEGELVTDVMDVDEDNLDEAAILAGWKLDPTKWRMLMPLKVNRWPTTLKLKRDGQDEAVQVWNYQYAAKVVRREKHPDLAPLIEEIARHKPAPKVRPVGHQSLVVCFSDWQMGKSDGDGTAGTVARILAAIDALPGHVERLRGFGWEIGDLYVFGVGDIIESCDGHYPQQAFRAELNLRDQVKVARRLVAKALEEWSPLFDRVVVGCVGGNHGESRKDGKSFTDFADNHDVGIFEQVAEICAANPDRYGHVSFRIPRDELSLTFDVSGVVVGLTHGHTAGKGAGMVQKKLLDWWMKQSHGMQPVGDATILVSGHYHHFSVIESGRKVHIQCPAMEGGSDWWRNVSGQESRPGMLTMVVGEDVSPAGYAALEIL